jgi:hypothetical protein
MLTAFINNNSTHWLPCSDFGHVNFIRCRYSFLMSVDVEAVVRPGIRVSMIDLKRLTAGAVADLRRPLLPGEQLTLESLSAFVAELRVCDLTDPRGVLVASATAVNVHAFALHPPSIEEEPLDEDVTGEASLPACHVIALPNELTQGVWESLIFETDLKAELLAYAETALMFSKRHVNANLVAWNRLVLMHGPPGTGKTSLCKALAHKLSIRMRHTFRTADFVEINSHSLFSRWFSESGKQVMMLFKRIREMADDASCLVCVLIDEVESLASSRKAALSGSEPSDSIRVVNALLTQIDALRRLPNVLIMTTSNITESIDLAFVDRADLKIHLPPPSRAVKAALLASGIQELVRCGIVAEPGASGPSEDDASSRPPPEERMLAAARELIDSVHGSAMHDISGRTLRKLPMLAFVAGRFDTNRLPVPFEAFLAALQLALGADLTARAAVPSG